MRRTISLEAYVRVCEMIVYVCVSPCVRVSVYVHVCVVLWYD